MRAQLLEFVDQLFEKSFSSLTAEPEQEWILPQMASALAVDSNNEDFSISDNISFNDSDEAFHSRKTIVGDFNGDNKPDVVRPQGGHDFLGKPTITLSNSDNSYTFRLIGDGPDMQSHTVCSGDIDNDGDLDLFFAQSGELGNGLVKSLRGLMMGFYIQTETLDLMVFGVLR